VELLYIRVERKLISLILMLQYFIFGLTNYACPSSSIPRRNEGKSKFARKLLLMQPSIPTCNNLVKIFMS